MQITIKEVDVGSVLDSADLLKMHYNEIAKNKSVMVLDPDRARYQSIERAGKILCLASFDRDKIVGYSVNIIDTHIHYAELVCCVNDVLFVDPVYRNSRCGLMLIKHTESVAKDRGAKLMLWHAKSGTALDALMPKLGYGVQDIIYSKVI
jgi:GNAT superfamily N-acetyltransferase